MIKEIHHINLVAPKALIEELCEFYEAVLGLKRGFRPNFEIDGYWLYNDNGPRVHLLVGDRSATETGHLDHVAFSCTGLEQTRKTLNELSIDYSSFSVEEDGRDLIFLTDPAGTPLELIFERRQQR